MRNLDLAIITSVFGQFEKVWRPIHQPPEIQSILVTDLASGTSHWEKAIPASRLFSTPRLANRFHKMLHFTKLSLEGLSVYLDGNVRPINNLLPLFEAFEESGADIGMYRHYARASVREEAHACLQRKKVDNPEAVAEELRFYADAGFPDTGGMWEGSVIFRRHSSPRLRDAMEDWWDLYSRFQTRDQFSLPFVIWKHGLKVYDLDEHSPGREHYFVRLQHSQAGIRNRLARYLQARAPENFFWSALQHAARSLDRS